MSKGRKRKFVLTGAVVFNFDMHFLIFWETNNNIKSLLAKFLMLREKFALKTSSFLLYNASEI